MMNMRIIWKMILRKIDGIFNEFCFKRNWSDGDIVLVIFSNHNADSSIFECTVSEDEVMK